MIPSVLTLAAVSIGLLLTAVALRSRSVATLNFMICLIAWVVIWFVVAPMTPFDVHAPSDEELRLNWITAMIGNFLFLASIAGLVYCIIIMRLKNSPNHGRNKKRRRKRRSSRAVEQNDGGDQGDDAGDDDSADPTSGEI